MPPETGETTEGASAGLSIGTPRGFRRSFVGEVTTLSKDENFGCAAGSPLLNCFFSADGSLAAFDGG